MNLQWLPRILTHPLIVTIFGGTLLWIIQFNVTRLAEQASQKTAHYEVILKDKIKLYYQLQTQSNQILNHLRLLDKLTRYQKENIQVPFDIQTEISDQYMHFVTKTKSFMNFHYDNYMLQSAAAKSGYESFLQQIMKGLRPERFKNQKIDLTLGINIKPGLVIYDIDVNSRFGQSDFMKKTYKSWHAYIEILASELKWDSINLDIKPLKEIDDENQ